MCSIHIDEPTTIVNYCVTITSLGIFSKKLNRLYPPRTTHGSRNDALKWVLWIRGDADFCNGVAPLGL
jgi:hypothetical protein